MKSIVGFSFMICNCLLSSLSHLKRLIVLLFLQISHDPLIPSSLSLFLGPDSGLLRFSFSPVFFGKFLDFIFAEGSAAFGEEFYDNGPVDRLLLEFSLHAVEHFLERLSRNTGAAGGVSGDSGVDGPYLGILAEGQEEG